jgi:hypothetical protein
MKYSDKRTLPLSPNSAIALCRAALKQLRWNVRDETGDRITGEVLRLQWSFIVDFVLAFKELSSALDAGTEVTVTLDAPAMKDDLLQILPSTVKELFSALPVTENRSITGNYDREPKLLTSGSSGPVTAYSFGSLSDKSNELTQGSAKAFREFSKDGREFSFDEPLHVPTTSAAAANVEHPAKPSAADPETKTRLIFVSYRREDSPDTAGRIYDRLVQQFGSEAIFKDVDSIPLGVDFKQYLEKQVQQCNVLLAVIGKSWLKKRTGKRRLDDPRDFVRIELASALQRDIPVIPLMVNKARMPSESDLPEDLRGLVFRNFIQIRPDPDFHNDMNRLIKELERLP